MLTVGSTTHEETRPPADSYRRRSPGECHVPILDRQALLAQRVCAIRRHVDAAVDPLSCVPRSPMFLSLETYHTTSSKTS